MSLNNFIELVLSELKYDLNLIAKEGIETANLIKMDKQKTIYGLATVLATAQGSGYTEEEFAEALEVSEVSNSYTIQKVYEIESELDLL